VPHAAPKSESGVCVAACAPPRTRRTSVSEMQAEMKEMVQYFKSSRPVEPGRPVLAPGDPERAAMAERSASEPGRFHLGIGPY
jgi:LDH2 family malate/lactate/ureidoglycolate dehydrogenase